DSWMLPVMSEYCVMTLNSGLVPNCVKKLVMCCASALGVAAVPHVSDGPQKIGTTFALRITGPLWYLTFDFCPTRMPTALSFVGKGLTWRPLSSVTRSVLTG